MPVNFVSFLDGCRFVNWLENGRLSGAQDATTTENGTYDMSLPPDQIVRQPGAHVFLPTEDEWYKAAYYKSGGLDAGYWDYATQSDDLPTGESPPGGPTSVNAYDGGYAVGPPYWFAPVGAYYLACSAYGTFDQAGNAWEFNETPIEVEGQTYRGMRGGAYTPSGGGTSMSSSYRDNVTDHTNSGQSMGFRVASTVWPDCNRNGVPDESDLAVGTSDDVNTNGIPDECDDCNSNGEWDDWDIRLGTSEDCNNNAIPDDCDIANCAGEPWCADCNTDGLPDVCGAPPAGFSWVLVGDAGNEADTQVMDDGTVGYGAVPYEYLISRHEVTNDQYIEFLKAVAAADPNELYHPDMAGQYGGIDRTGSPGDYDYSAKGGDPDWRDRPVSFVNFLDVCRFVNWLANGKPTGAQDASTTEDGTYDLSLPPEQITRKAGAQVFLPTEDEWYKAAYYKAGGTNAGYWDYATQSDDLPTGEAPPGGPTSVNA